MFRWGTGGRGRGRRAIEAEQVALDPATPEALLDYLATFGRRGWRKALAFCNTRTEIERYAAAVRAAGSPFGDAVFVHYSNLSWERRREIEQQFAGAEAALCFASSTLELGIDIGNIDVTLLIGAPGSQAAFTQRVGRASRRRRTVQVACFYRSPLERLMFAALLNPADLSGQWSGGSGQRSAPAPQAGMPSGPRNPQLFRPSVAVQQIFSLLKQSPSGAVRLAPLSALFAGLLNAADLEAILGTLQARGYLQSGRAGEWRAGERLNDLVDRQAAGPAARQPTFSLHSNLALENAGQIAIRDQHSGRIVANVDRQWLEAPTADAGRLPCQRGLGRRRGVVGLGLPGRGPGGTFTLSLGPPGFEL